MKKFTIFTALVAMLVSFTSCEQNVDETLDSPIGQTSITLNLPQTRTSLGDKAGDAYPVYWSENDQIVVDGAVSDYAAIGNNKSSATFNFANNLTYPYNITYPYTSGSLCSSSKPTVVFADEQQYVENTFGVGYAPMCGYAEKTGSITLKHLAGILRFAIKGETTLSKIEIIADEGIALAGEFDVNCQTGTISAINSRVSNKITYTANQLLSTTTAKPFYIAVPSGSFGECKVVLTDQNGQQMNLKWNGSNVKQGVVREFKTIEFQAGATMTLESINMGSYEDEWPDIGPKPMFTVEFLNVTPQMASYVCTPVDNEMLYLLVSSQDLGYYGVNGETPAEKMQAYLQMLADFGMLTGEADQWFVFKGASTESPKEASRWSAEESVQVYAAGFKAVPTGATNEYGYPIMNTSLITTVHVWNVPFLPYPSLTVAESDMVKNVTSAAGSVTIDCVLENPFEGAEVVFETSATWVVPIWADNKLTLAYEANTAAVARRAKIAVSYGYYTNPIEVTLVQEKNGEATPITLNVEVTGTQFNGIWVNVTPSDPNVLYALGATTPEDWAIISENLLSYISSAATFHKGALKGLFIKTNPTNYQWYGYDYYVYAVAVDATSEETTDYNGNPKTNWTVNQILSEAYYDRTTIDVSAMPSLAWDLTKNPELVWNENYERYDLTVVEGSTVVLHYIVNNPVEGGKVALNGTTLFDNYNVVDGEPVIDNAAGTITFKIDAFDTSKRYHYVSPSFKYTNADNDTWGITTPNLHITQIER